jgi:hypothetical protein
MPSPWLDASHTCGLSPLVECIDRYQATLIVLDNLLMIKGRVDENSDEMGTVMANLRRLVEDLGVVLCVIHHQRKAKGDNTHAGDQLRGHSSILAALNLALRVDRQPGSDTVTLESTKSREVPVEPFGAILRYKHREETTDLSAARFWGTTVKDHASDRAIAQAVLGAVTEQPLMNQSHLIKAVRPLVDGVGDKRIIGIIDKLVNEGKLITRHGQHNGKCYQVP